MKPFLKWAGGKMKLLSILMDKFPKGKRFIEPFIGSGSISLNVDYPEYIINDVNNHLFLVWKSIEIFGIIFVEDCKKLFVSKNNNRETYNLLRKEFNETKDNLRKAVLFIYLNRHCFNGICRYNSKGEFNVPFGKYDKPYFPEKELISCIEKIKNFEIYNLDFRDIFKMVKKGDVVYCDPPYLPLSKTANFNKYSKEGFSFQDQKDLISCAKEAVKKGATVVISNHYNDLAKEIYKDADITIIDVARTISSKANNRKSVKEIIAVYK